MTKHLFVFKYNFSPVIFSEIISVTVAGILSPGGVWNALSFS